MTKSISKPLRICKVEGRRALRDFIRVPFNLYTDDPNWVPPLLIEQRQRLSPRNPFFAHARWSAWLACRGQTPVGRISAQIDDLHLQRYRDATGFFGFLEAPQDPEVFAALFDAAAGWLRQRGMRRVRGPFNLSINEECGLLVEGLDTPPSIMMGHARPYYPASIEEQGYQPVQTLLAYRIRPDFEAPRVMTRLAAQTAGNIRLRPLRRARLDEELEILRDIFNDAWSENWGFVPFTRAEFAEIGKNLSLLIDDDFVQIAEVDGEPGAMVIALPNINEIIRDLNGRLLPLGWLKILWRLKVNYPKTARIPLMGVRKQYHLTRTGQSLTFLVVDRLRRALIRRGIETVEMSWILEGNTGVRNFIEATGGTVYKRYRIYEKALDTT